MNNTDWILTLFGGWLVLDGVGSLIMYRDQSLPEQSVRVVRTGIGVVLMAIALN